MLLWDPVAANTPVASISVGRPINSACFSAGDPYALVCAPELGGTVGERMVAGRGEKHNGAGNDDLVQIWDLRWGQEHFLFSRALFSVSWFDQVFPQAVRFSQQFVRMYCVRLLVVMRDFCALYF